MSDRQALIDWLRHWKHEVPTTREREEMIEAMRDAATAIEEAQGVPREPTPEMIEAGRATDEYDLHPAACELEAIWRAMYDAAPAAPTRDEQDAKRLMAEWRRECDDGDKLLRLLHLDPEHYRTEGGGLSLPKIAAALGEMMAARDYEKTAHATTTKNLREYIAQLTGVPRSLGWEDAWLAALAEPKR